MDAGAIDPDAVGADAKGESPVPGDHPACYNIRVDGPAAHSPTGLYPHPSYTSCE